jgi:hypothetical protein
MSRAIVLPSSGNVFMDTYQWTLIKKRIYDTFDEFIVLLNTPLLTPELAEQYRSLYKDDKVKFLSPVAGYMGHSDALFRLVNNVESDVVCFFESDFFVMDPTIIDSAFEKIERGDVDYIGEPRGFCSEWILDSFRVHYQDMEFKYDDGSSWNWPDIEKWPGRSLWFAMWPCGFYIKTDIIKDRKFFDGSTIIKRGDLIPELDGLISEEDVAHDTFGYAGLILHHNKYRFDIQNLSSYDDSSKYTLLTGLHMIDEDVIQNTRYKSVHTCNSSAFLNSNGMHSDEPLTRYLSSTLSDPNCIKNVVICDSFLDVYNHMNPNCKFYEQIKNRWDRVMNEIRSQLEVRPQEFQTYKSQREHLTYDRLINMSELYTKEFESYI